VNRAAWAIAFRSLSAKEIVGAFLQFHFDAIRKTHLGHLASGRPHRHDMDQVEIINFPRIVAGAFYPLAHGLLLHVAFMLRGAAVCALTENVKAKLLPETPKKGEKPPIKMTEAGLA
jgi:hypothetical protein